MDIAGFGRRLPFHFDVHRRLTLVHHPPEHRLESIGQSWGQHFSERAPNIGVDRKPVDVGKGLIDADKPQIRIDECETGWTRLVEPVQLFGLVLGFRSAFTQFCFDLPVVVNVRGGADPANDRSRVAADRDGPRQLPAILAVGTEKAMFEFVGFSEVQALEPAVGHELPVLGMNGSQPAEADRFIESESHVFETRLIDVFDESGGRGDEDDLRHRIGEGPIPCLAFAQRSFCRDAS